jgi:hypothetical protein
MRLTTPKKTTNHHQEMHCLIRIIMHSSNACIIIAKKMYLRKQCHDMLYTSAIVGNDAAACPAYWISVQEETLAQRKREQ